MSDVDLLFSQTPKTQPATLVFGGDTVVIPKTQVTGALQLPLPAMLGSIATITRVSGVLTLPAPSLSAQVEYRSGTTRPVVGTTAASWQRAGHAQSGTEERSARLAALPLHAAPGWHAARRTQASTGLRLPYRMRRLHHAGMVVEREAAARRSTITTGHRDLSPLRPALASGFQDGRGASTARQSGWQDYDRRQRPQVLSKFGEALALSYATTSRQGVARALDVLKGSRFQEAMRPRPGVTKIVIPPTPWDPCYLPPPGSAVALLFKDGTVDGKLVFICERHAAPVATIVIPVKRTYFVMNDFKLLRVSDGAELPALAPFSMRLDMDSWTWAFSASLAVSGQAMLTPPGLRQPVEIEAHVNGATFRFLAEEIKRDRTFGDSRLSVSGRGKSALLADKYCPVMNFHNRAGARTAHQLADEALMLNGVPIGWTVNWGISDWIVPAGSWNHQGTYMSALSTIAAAAGAFVLPDPVTQTLSILPRYKAKPWEWASATPDVEVPADVLENEGVVYYENPDYNGIYVSGATENGVLGFVKRTGTAGNVLAPMIVDALITSVIPAESRGISVLAKSGFGANYTLSLPVLPAAGIIQPGKLIRYADHGNTSTGVVKGVSVNVQMPSIRQTIEVETHA